MKWSQRVLSVYGKVIELRLTHVVPDSRGRERGCFAKLVTRRPAPIARGDGRVTLCEPTKPAKPRDDAGPLLSPGAGGRRSSWPGGSVKGRGEEPWLWSERGIFIQKWGVL